MALLSTFFGSVRVRAREQAQVRAQVPAEARFEARARVQAQELRALPTKPVPALKERMRQALRLSKMLPGE